MSPGFDECDRALPMMSCPRCGKEQPDFDGIGVIFCEVCRFCRHLSRGFPAAEGVCNYCGDRDVAEDHR